MDEATRSADGCPDVEAVVPVPMTCKKCGKELRRDNRSGNCYKCRTYAGLTPYGKQGNCDRSRKNHAEFRIKIAAIKLERGCVDCGYSRYAEALDFDHLPGAEKTKSIALMWGWSWEKVLAEIDKCEVVCSNCHRHRTKVRAADTKAAAAELPAAPRLERSRRAVAACGTESAHRRHVRHGEEPCDECKAAAASAGARRYQAKKSAPIPGQIAIGF